MGTVIQTGFENDGRRRAFAFSRIAAGARRGAVLWYERRTGMIIQLGITLIMPLLLCIAFCWWLCDAFGAGVWVYLPGIVLGLGAGMMSAYKFYRAVMRRQGRQKEDSDKASSAKRPTAYNDHI